MELEWPSQCSWKFSNNTKITVLASNFSLILDKPLERSRDDSCQENYFSVCNTFSKIRASWLFGLIEIQQVNVKHWDVIISHISFKDA